MSHIGKELFQFFRELAKNNDRDWFQRNKPRYERHVKEPLLQFVSDFGPHLRRINSHLVADPRPVGGSLFRIHRDVRLSLAPLLPRIERLLLFIEADREAAVESAKSPKLLGNSLELPRER